MANLTFDDELKALYDLIRFKKFIRYGNALFTEYCGELRPERTVSELVWGWCHNPCFAKGLIDELMRTVPDYPKLLGNANRSVQSSLIAKNFDQAMVLVCSKQPNHPHLAYSSESTNSGDCVFEENINYCRMLNATEEDGELWNGLLISGENWAHGVKSIKVSIYGGEHNLLWQYTFSGSSIQKRVHHRNDVYIFQPFKHPLPLLDLDITVQTKIVFKTDATDLDATQLFGVISNGFCEWLQQARFEVKLCKKSIAMADLRARTIVFK